MLRGRRVLLILLSLVFVLGTVLAGCGGGGDQTQEKPSDTGTKEPAATPEKPADVQELHLIIGDEPPTLDSSKATDTISFLLFNNAMEGLMRIGEDNKPIPGIAESFDVNSEGTSYTFHLRDAKWSDGSPVTAKDFEYAWKRALDPATAATYAYIMYFIKGAEEYNTGKSTDPNSVGVKALDDKTLQVDLTAPAPFFVGLTAFGTFMPLKEEYVKTQGDKYATEAGNLLFNGPFVISDWAHDQSVTLAKNPNYWDANTVKLEKITFDVIKDVNTAVSLYEAGDIDRAGLSSDQVDIYKNDPNFFTTNQLATSYLAFNTTKSPLDNVKIRHALSAAIDRQAFVDAILNNGSTPAEGYVPPGIPGLNDTFRAESGNLIVSGDVEYAKKMLQEGLAELKLDKLPELHLLTSDSDTVKKAGEVMKEMWRQNLGVDVVLDQVPFKERLKRGREGNFDIVLSGWFADFNDPVNFLDMFVTDGGFNDPQYNNPEYDELINFSKKTPDTTARMNKLLEAEKILMRDLPIAPIYFYGSAYVLRPYVKGLVNHPFGADTDYKWAYIEGKGQ
jgi:oligopeptide transport system substrate-binding protein